MSGWGSRFWTGGGRFSPFGAQPYPPQVADDEYDYITDEQIMPPGAVYDPHRSSRSPSDDRIILRHRGSSYPILFPAYSIDSAVLTTAQLRLEAAKALGVPDPRRLKLLYKGRILKDDLRPCREEGLKIDSEVLCVFSDSPQETDQESAEVTESDRGDGGAGAGETSSKKRRTRRRKNKAPRAEAGPDPGLAPPEAPSDATSRSASPGPKTGMDKLDELASYFNIKLLPQCLEFTSHPPSDPAKLEFEHRRLSETILSQFMLKLDAVETDGDSDTRQRRKDLVNQAQQVLKGLDAVMNKGIY